MLLPSRLLTALTGSLMVLALAAPSAVSAHDRPGTHAWSEAELTLRSDYGPAFQLTGTIAAKQPIVVLRCHKLWCLVEGDNVRGWTSKQFITFGRKPAH